MAEVLGYAFHAQDPSDAPSGEDLLRYVRDGNLVEATNALVKGTNPNFQDPQTGDAALQIAVLIKSEILVKSLIVFDADLKLKNIKQETALDLARKEGATNIAADIELILQLQNDLDADHPRQRKVRPQSAENDPEDVLLLSLDGGGIRGLVFIQVFLEMDKRRKKLYPDSSPLLPCFNWVTGNSTGGIAALAFAAAKTDPVQGRRLYFELKDQVLGGKDLPFPNEKVDAVFQGVFGKSTTNNESKGFHYDNIGNREPTNPAHHEQLRTCSRSPGFSSGAAGMEGCESHIFCTRLLSSSRWQIS